MNQYFRAIIMTNSAGFHQSFEFKQKYNEFIHNTGRLHKRTKIVITSSDAKLISKLKKGRYQYRTAKTMLGMEQGLYEEIHPLLTPFRRYVTQHLTKQNNDSAIWNQHGALNSCKSVLVKNG